MNSALMDAECTLVVRSNPFDSDMSFARVPAGQTLAQMLGLGAAHSLSVSVGGHEVPSAFWGITRPKAGQTIHAMCFPQGGNAGKYIRLVALVALAYFTMGASGWAVGAANALGGTAAGWSAGIMLVGSLSGSALTAQGPRP